MIKTVLEQAIKTIEAEKAQKISVIKEKVTREKIAPFNAEIDNARAKALAEVDTEMAQEISAIKQKYEAKKQELIALGEEKKKINAETVLAGETAVIASEYDNHIAKLTAQLAEIKE